MLKFFFWTLLFANAGLLAYQQGALETLLPSSREPARIANQLNADKVRLIPPPPVRREPPPPPVPEPAVVAEQKAEPLACVEIGNFNAAEARRFSAQLDALALGERVSQRPVLEVGSHFVYIPPQPDQEAAEKKAAELRALGIDDFFIIQDNPALRWAISLGVFKQEEAARTHLANLTLKGVRSARIGQRRVNTGLVTFALRGIGADTKAAVEKMAAGFPKQTLRDCAPA